MIIWPGIEGYNYPFQTPYAESWARFVDGVGQAAQHAQDRGVTVFLEHKNSEPAMKILMRNIGMTLHVIHKLRRQGIDNVNVNMDWQHLIMNGENLAEYAALLAAEGLLGHQHANDGWGTFDDDNMVGAIRFMETLELAVELRRAGYGENGERLGFDLYPVHRGRGRRRQAERAAVAVHRRDRREDRRRGAAGGAAARRTRCAPTSSSTPRWAHEAATRLGRDRRRTAPTRRARSTAACSASRRSPCRRSSTRASSSGSSAGGDLELHLMQTGDEPPPSAHFCLAVDSGLDELRARVEAAGVETRTPTEIVGRPRFMCSDPFGNLVELTELPR